jgi:hypothetical protein
VAELLHFRDAVRSVAPWWLARVESTTGKMLWAFGLMLDGLVEAQVAAIKVRFPGLYSFESLPLLGRERRIRRGPNESDEVYATRLPRWLDDHRLRGGPYALLEQVRAYWAPDAFKVDLVYRSGRRFQMDPGTTIVRDDIEWDYDEKPEKWARWSLFYFWSDELVSDDGTWDDPGTWDDGGVWDSNLTVEQAEDIRAVPSEWNNAHCFGEVVLLSGDRELWDYPAGTWDDPGVWEDYGPARLAVE